MTEAFKTPSRNELADEIDAIGADFVAAYGHLPKDRHPGPPLELATRLCRVRDSLRTNVSETTCRDAVIEECAVALDQAEEAAAAPHTFVDAIRALKGRSDVASTERTVEQAQALQNEMDAARYRWLADAAGRDFEELLPAQMMGRMGEVIDARIAADRTSTSSWERK